VSTTFPEHVKDDESVFVIVMTFFLNDVGESCFEAHRHWHEFSS
jgi:hypothetical protein